MNTRLLLYLLFTFSCLLNAHAGSATWNSDPASSDWNTPTNWTPATVPERETDTATFGASHTTNISNSDKLGIAGIEFLPQANPYTITWITQRTVTFVGNGVTNNSIFMQSFIVGNDISNNHATLTFTGSATAGSMTSYSNYGFAGIITFADESSAGSATLANSVSDPGGNGGLIQFTGSSTADHASFVNSGNALLSVGGQIIFYDTATAADATFFNLAGLPPGPGSGGLTWFHGTSTADHGIFICEGALAPEITGGRVAISDEATAANGTFTMQGGGAAGAQGGSGSLDFGADAGNAIFTINGGQVSGALGGYIYCFAPTGNPTFLVNGGTVSGALGGILYVSGLENATIIANPSANGGGAAQIQPYGATIGARIELMGDGALAVDKDRVREITVGSIEGQGRVSLGRNHLSVGSNNLSTTFSGRIDGGEVGRGGGILTKIGTGTLTLTGHNTYAGGTTVESGILLANNAGGSGTGTNTIKVNGGTFGGGGKVSGDVIVGTGTGTGALLGPGARGIIPGSLTIQRTLTLLSTPPINALSTAAHRRPTRSKPKE